MHLFRYLDFLFTQIISLTVCHKIQGFEDNHLSTLLLVAPIHFSLYHIMIQSNVKLIVLSIT